MEAKHNLCQCIKTSIVKLSFITNLHEDLNRDKQQSKSRKENIWKLMYTKLNTLLVFYGKKKLLKIHPFPCLCFSFFVNLQNTMHMWPHPDIMLHVNPCFHASVGYGVIMNSWSKGKWGTEHKYPLLFTPGRPFSMKILCKRDEYLVTVDGVNLGAYRYLSSTHTVNTIYIEGDVFIKEVTVS